MTARLPHVPPAAAARPKLLIVDDQPVNLQALYHAFSSDHQVFMATSGEQALALARDRQPDLVLLDVVMPGMDGHEVCRRLKADPATQDIPVIFVTAQDDPEDETRGLELGAVDFIAKPINPAIVRARARTHVTLKRQGDLLRQMVFVDGLTGVHNRRFLDEHLADELQRCVREGRDLALVLLDVDFFKRFNDRHGHQAGDDCLRQVAAAVKGAMRRPTDVVARYGGEEFACVVPDVDESGALALAFRISEAVRTLAIPHGDSGVGDHVSVSLGVARALPPAPGASALPPSALVEAADRLLYRAKAAGRAQAAIGVAGAG
jgi:diguanylate cyclase (GGDEF)-like protein